MIPWQEFLESAQENCEKKRYTAAAEDYAKAIFLMIDCYLKTKYLSLCKSHPNKTLAKHIEEIEEIFRKLVAFYELDCLLNRDKGLNNLFREVIEYHDIGKCRKEFQEYIRKLEREEKAKSPGSHTLWSLEKLYKKETKFNTPTELLPLLFLLIAKHHSNLTLDFSTKTEEIIAKLIAKYIYNYPGELKKKEIEEFLMKLYNDKKISESEINEAYERLIGLLSGVRSFYKDYFKRLLEEKNREFLITVADLFGLFKIADVLSARNALDTVNDLTYIEKINKKKIRAVINKKVDLGRWNIQKALSRYNYLILRAPTGWGKTTTSLLFAQNKQYKKIFLVLPTITAIKEFHDKFKQQELKVEMYFYLYDALLSIQDTIDERLNTFFYIQNLYSPINITTVDQILLAFLQAGRYFLKRLNLRKSVIILDEVHLLTPQMIFLLRKFIEYLVPLYDIKLALMSATLPRGLAEYLLDNSPICFNKIDIYGIWNNNPNPKYYNRERFEIIIKGKDILDDIGEIVKYNDEGKSVLVIVNTVEKAVALYKKLKDNFKKDNILLLHGRFSMQDREAKEEKIDSILKKKGILVATQVAEVSLDKDFDILFTELAPISSIVQRAGRVNRYGTKPKAKVFIYYPKELKEIKEDRRKKYPYEVEELEKTLIILKELVSSKVFKEGILISLIDQEFTKEFYEDLIKDTVIDRLFKELFEDKDSPTSVYWFLSTSSEEKGRELLELRENTTSLIIPSGGLLMEEKLKNEISKLLKKYEELKKSKANYEEWRKFIAEVKRYAVPIPMWILLKSSYEKSAGFPVVDSIEIDGHEFKYHSKYGFIDLVKLEKYGINKDQFLAEEDGYKYIL